MARLRHVEASEGQREADRATVGRASVANLMVGRRSLFDEIVEAIAQVGRGPPCLLVLDSTTTVRADDVGYPARSGRRFVESGGVPLRHFLPCGQAARRRDSRKGRRLYHSSYSGCVGPMAYFLPRPALGLPGTKK